MSKSHIEFRYSPIYDEQWRFVWNSNSENKKNDYPETDGVVLFLKKLEKEWRKNEDAIFRTIKKVTGLFWVEKMHPCYVVGRASPFSDPLTMPVFSDQAPIDYVSDVLTHELIHRNLIQINAQGVVSKGLRKLQKKYSTENENVIIHVIVHAIFQKVLEQTLGLDRVEREKRIMGDFDDYRRAWQIVGEAGPDKILVSFFGNNR